MRNEHTEVTQTKSTKLQRSLITINNNGMSNKKNIHLLYNNTLNRSILFHD